MPSDPLTPLNTDRGKEVARCVLSRNKTAWQAGKVRVGLPARGNGTNVTIEAPGMLGLKAKFLSSAEKSLLAKAAKADSKPLANSAE